MITIFCWCCCYCVYVSCVCQHQLLTCIFILFCTLFQSVTIYFSISQRFFFSFLTRYNLMLPFYFHIHFIYYRNQCRNGFYDVVGLDLFTLFIVTYFTMHINLRLLFFFLSFRVFFRGNTQDICYQR